MKDYFAYQGNPAITDSRDGRRSSALLYGSRAMGTHRHGSDIDLCLLGAQLNVSALLKINDEIDELLRAWA